MLYNRNQTPNLVSTTTGQATRGDPKAIQHHKRLVSGFFRYGCRMSDKYLRVSFICSTPGQPLYMQTTDFAAHTDVNLALISALTEEEAGKWLLHRLALSISELTISV